MSKDKTKKGKKSVKEYVVDFFFICIDNAGGVPRL